MAKGVQFESLDDPRLPSGARARFAALARRESWTTGKEVSAEEVFARDAAAWNARWAVVETCAECGRELIAGELERHVSNTHVPASVRSIAREILELEPLQRAELLALFHGDGRTKTRARAVDPRELGGTLRMSGSLTVERVNHGGA
jgi:hypothetical protein